MSSPQASNPPGPAEVAETDRPDASVLPLRREAAGDAPAAPPSEEPTQHPSVACGACAGRIGLRDFVLVGGSRVTRTADCPQCGETTAISLV